MKTIIGTCNFVSFEKALSCYSSYGFNESDVLNKIKQNEIKIGKPEVKTGEKLVLIDNGSRYGVQTK